MSGLSSHLASVAALTSAVGVVLMKLGVGTGLLQQRRTTHRCPACGRQLGRHGCEHCGY